MSDVTLELIKAKQTELATMIQALEQRAQLTVSLPAVEIQLLPGEHYAGPVLDEHGRVTHHLVLLAARVDQDLNWSKAKAWAKDAGGSLPTRQEQALLFANCKPHLPQRWCWSSEAEGSSYAWDCDFINGNQTFSTQSAEGCAVAVRRFNP